MEDVSVKEGLSYDSVAGVLERRIETNVDWTTIAEIEILGLDEIALRERFLSSRISLKNDQIQANLSD